MRPRPDWRSVPLPERMQGLDRDPRGFPIPFLVLRTADGAQFTINDEAKHVRCLAQDLCAICGTKLFRGRWFVGGPLCAFHEDGLYLDTPLHAECARYALQVCPYLAAPKYAGRIDDAKFDWTANPGMKMLIDRTMIPEAPSMNAAGEWAEVNAASGNRTHTAKEIVEALGPMKITMEVTP